MHRAVAICPTLFVIGQNRFGILKFVQSKHSCSGRSPASPLPFLPCKLFLDRFNVHIRSDLVKSPPMPLNYCIKCFYLWREMHFQYMYSKWIKDDVIGPCHQYINWISHLSAVLPVPRSSVWSDVYFWSYNVIAALNALKSKQIYLKNI